MQEPLVSVIIPVYNGANYMQEAIDSVLEQTYSNIEILVVNDGSNDEGKTEKIALSYGNKIRYISKPNGGVASALNEGICHMCGEYFAWLSHDDIFYKEKISKQVEILQKSRALVTACAYDIFYDAGRKIGVPFVDFYGKENIEKSVFSVIHSLIQFGGVLLHRSIFDKYGVFREDLRTTQDYEFLFRILRKENCEFCNELLYGIRYHEAQGSNTISSVPMDRDDMYSMFISELDDNEKCILYGSVYNFYYQMLLRIWPMSNMDKSFSLCMKGLKESEWMPTSEVETIDLPVYIYGAGAYGKRILFDLHCRGIEVTGFIDGNSRLWGSSIEGLPCYSLEAIEKKNENKMIIIASIYREEIAEQLKRRGIENFIYKEDYERIRMESAPTYERIQEEIMKYGANKDNF